MGSAEGQMKINKLPTLTWNFLKLNGTAVESGITLNGRGRSIIKNIPSGVIVGSGGCDSCDGCDPKVLNEIRDLGTGLGDEADAFFNNTCDKILTIHHKLFSPVTITSELRTIRREKVYMRLMSYSGIPIGSDYDIF